MSLLVDDEAFVDLSPALLALFECRLHGFWRLQLPGEAPSVPAVVGRAAHLVLSQVAKQGWPIDYDAALPDLVAQTLRSQWSRFSLAEEQLEPRRLHLVETLRRFLGSWRPPTGAEAYPNLGSWHEDLRWKMRLQGHLDLALAPQPPSTGLIAVVDWRTSADPPAGNGEPPLPVVAQAILARAQLGLHAPAIVRWVSIDTGAEQVWHLGQQQLAEGWEGIHQLALDIRRGRWVAHPCHLCPGCPVRGCRYKPELPEATAFAMTWLEELGLSFWRRPDATPSSEPGA